jgi:cell division protein FtsB
MTKMKRLKKGRVILICIIILTLIVLLLSFLGNIKDQNAKVELYARLLQKQQMKIEQLEERNSTLEQINLNQHNEIRELQGSQAMSVNTVAPTTEKDKDVDVDTKTAEGTNGFDMVDSVKVGAASVGIFLGSALKFVRVLPVIP